MDHKTERDKWRHKFANLISRLIIKEGQVKSVTFDFEINKTLLNEAASEFCFLSSLVLSIIL